MKIIIFIYLCILPAIFCASNTSQAIYPPLSASRGIDILVPFANSKNLAACLITDSHSYQATFLVYNVSSQIANTTNHTIYSYTLPNGSYIDYLDALNSYGQEYFAGYFEINGTKSIQIFNYTGIANPVYTITDVWQRVIIQGQANVKCSSCVLYGTMNLDGSWNFVQYDWMQKKQIFKITTDESLDDVYMLDTELVGSTQTIIYSAQKFISPFQVFSFVMVSSDGTEIWRKETSQAQMVIQAQQYYGNYMLVVTLDQQVKLIDRTTGNDYDELNHGFATDIRCSAMYPYVACTDYSLVKIWNWVPTQGSIATLVSSVQETSKIHDIGSNAFGLQFLYICGDYIKTINM